MNAAMSQALVGVVDAISAAQTEERLKGVPRLGLVACSLTETFNVTGSVNKDHTAQLSVDIKPPIPVPVGLNGSAKSDNSSKVSQGNTVVLVLKNPNYAPSAGSGASQKSAAQPTKAMWTSRADPPAGPGTAASDGTASPAPTELGVEAKNDRKPPMQPQCPGGPVMMSKPGASGCDTTLMNVGKPREEMK